MSKAEVSAMRICREIDRFVHLQSLSDLKFIEITNLEYKIVLHYSVRDKDLKQEYKFEVENYLTHDQKDIYKQSPVVRLLSPQISINLDIHMLTFGQICYTFPGDIGYNKGLTCGYAVEQSFKWAFGYEYYLKNHVWPFSEMPHGVYPIFWGFSRPGIAA